MPRSTTRPDGLVDVQYSVTETAGLVRAALKDAFPGQTFSVRSDRYAGGASIDVTWTDGPISAQVEKVVKRFEGATFDGMIDLKSYVTRTQGKQRIHYGADYVMCQRDTSADLLRACAERIADKYDCPPPEVRESSYTHRGKTITHAYIERNGEPLDRYADGRVANYASSAGDKALALAYETSTYHRP